MHLLIILGADFLLSLIIIAFDSGAESLPRPRPKVEMMILAGVGVAAAAMLLAIIGVVTLYT